MLSSNLPQMGYVYQSLLHDDRTRPVSQIVADDTKIKKCFQHHSVPPKASQDTSNLIATNIQLAGTYLKVIHRSVYEAKLLNLQIKLSSVLPQPTTNS
jgi:hypothetical protein